MGRVVVLKDGRKRYTRLHGHRVDRRDVESRARNRAREMGYPGSWTAVRMMTILEESPDVLFDLTLLADGVVSADSDVN